MKKFILLILGVVMLSLVPVRPVEAKDPFANPNYCDETYTVDGIRFPVNNGEPCMSTLDDEDDKTTTPGGSGGGGTIVPVGDCEGKNFLFMRPWYDGLQCDANGKLDPDQFSSDRMGDTLQKIILVVTEDIIRVIGILAAGFLIYGGIQYAASGGDVAKATRGQKTITAAIIGLVITLVAQVVRNTFETLVKNANGGTGVPDDISQVSIMTDAFNIWQLDSEAMLQTVINFVLGATVLISVGFIIYSGIIMMTSYGDPNKTAKGRKGILYAVAGLLVSMLAFAIVNFVLGGLRVAMPDNNVDIFKMVNTLFSWILGIGGFLAAVGIVVGGVQYTTSSGDAQKTQKAKQTLLYSIVGLIVVLVAGAIVSFVIKAVFK